MAFKSITEQNARGGDSGGTLEADVEDLNVNGLAAITRVASLTDANMAGVRSVAVSGGYVFMPAFAVHRLCVAKVNRAVAATTLELIASPELDVGQNPRWVATSGHLVAIIAAGDGGGVNGCVELWDHTVKAAPVHLSTVADPLLRNGHRLVWHGRWLFAAAGSPNSIVVIDTLNPLAPEIAGSYVNASDLVDPYGFCISDDGRTLFATASGAPNLVSLNIEALPAITLRQVFTHASMAGPHDASLNPDGVLLMTDSGADALFALDPSDPGAIEYLDHVAEAGILNGSHSVRALGRDRAIVIAQSDSAIAVVDTTDPTDLTAVTALKDTTHFDGIRNLCIVGNELFTAGPGALPSDPGTTSYLSLVDLAGFVATAARVGTLSASTAHVVGEASAHHVEARSGLTVGAAGARIAGPAAFSDDVEFLGSLTGPDGELDPIADLAAQPTVWTRPTGAIAQTLPRNSALGSVGTLVSGRLQLNAIFLREGDTVSSITYFSGNVALNTGSNQWASLWDSSRNKLAVSADAGGAAWGTNSAKTFVLAVPYEVLADGWFYIGIVVVATTTPNLRGATSLANIMGVAPILAGTSDTGLTDPASAPATAAALTSIPDTPYAYLS